ncbi:MAG: carboxypeptidase regulatory-like domain-containing protein [Thermoanaerobaculia bacterium]|nr:carboxypeptidase regulatory-like domain-containing protein [Thermoanaerobaculia bacterium]
MRKWLLGCLVLALAAAPAIGQQTGSISGRVTSSEGEDLPGVTIEATSNVLPQARHTVSGANGEFRLPVLPPGNYEVIFTLAGMATERRNVAVALQQNSTVNVALAVETVTEQIQVVALSTMIDPYSAELKAAVSADVIESLPIGQEYRDLVKLIPGVQFTGDTIRGPSAGGSGQDNVYQFDGVNVNLPLFGTLSAEPSSHDIDQIAVVKGGANAVDFNRSAGFSINSVSKSGTNAFHGALSYQVQPESLTADRDTASASEFKEDKDWAIANLGGPIVPDRLFFYASYYRPTSSRDSRSNLYGDVPDFESERDEYFGKLTFAPSESMLLNVSYRTSERTESGTSVTAEDSSGSTSQGSEATLDIGIFEGSWVINEESFLTFKYTDFTNETQGRPDTLFGFTPAVGGGQNLDVGALQTQGLFTVPTPVANQTAYNEFIQPLINQYGYLLDGVRKGGGRVGGGSQLDNDDFFRTSYQAGYDFVLGSEVTHELHVGYQWFRDEEDLFRTSNGWGSITAPGGRLNCPTNSTCAGQKIYYQAQVQQQGILNVPTIHSEYEAQNVELNDVVRWRNFTLNLGLLVSNDELYGQGLREKSGTVSGFEVAKGNMYKMHEMDFEDMIQPRLGAIWAYDGPNTVYANFARYMPAASSLPRAASWARSLATTINVYFDAAGNFIGSSPEAGSSGKIFDEDLNPRTTDEYMLGTTRDFGNGWTARAHGRYRYGYNFWEDTNNDARLLFDPPEGVPQELYVENLAQIRSEIGGSSYVIAELDGAFTKYYEAGREAEYRGRNSYIRGSYVWSHYYGNFDQDNAASTGLLNDSNIFIGSSFIADGAGRQVWDFKYGNLRGDRRHQLKLFGYYTLPWQASIGAYAIYQSGQPWEIHSYEPYIELTSSVSDANRYAEPAGSRTTDDHYQLDLNYTQDFPLGDRFNLQARVDVFNVFDNQTGYDIQDNEHSSNLGTPLSNYDPRRFQVALKFEF